MALSNGAAAAQWAALIAQFNSGALTQPQLQDALTALFVSWGNTPAALGYEVAEALAELQAALAGFSAFGPKGAVDKVSSLPANPAPGDAYVVSANGHVYIYVSGQWVDLGGYQGPPGSTVVSMTFATNGPNTAGEKFPAYVADGSITLSAANSLGYADAPAAADATYTITRNAAAIGTALFKAGTAAPIVTLSATALSRGDVVRAVAPNPPDASLVGVSITISGNRT